MQDNSIKVKLSVLAACLLLGLLPAGASGSVALIQPGVQVNGTCTLNFVYDGIGVNDGRVFLGVAAHCVEAVGQTASTNARAEFGEVAYIGSPGTGATDFAFIEVDPEFVGLVSAEVKGHPGQPTGTTLSTETQPGEVVRFSGYGTGFGFTQETQEDRIGLLASDTVETWWAYAPITPGDSGGPALHASGKALGIVTTLGVSAGSDAVVVVGGSGPTIEGILAHAAADGFPVALRTV